MGLFRKKKSGEAEQIPEEKPVPRDESNWREWATLAKGFMADDNLPRAVEYWSEAIDRFDDQPKYLAKLHDDILEMVCRHLSEQVKAGKIIPGHMLAEMDVELDLKHPDFETTPFSEELFYHVKETISDASGPEETALTYICGAYSIVGYLRYTCDVKASAEKCQEVYNLGKYARDQCLSYKKGAYEGPLKPKMGAEFVETIMSFFDYLKGAFEKVSSEYSEGELSLVESYQNERRIDHLEHLSNALQSCIYSSGSGRHTRGKLHDRLESEIDLYLAEYLKKD